MQITLADFLARHGPLTPGQLVTVGVTIARELAMLHVAGAVHGGVSATAIRIDADGRPTLAGGSDASGDALDDVRALVDVLKQAAGPNVGLATLRVLGAPVDATAFARELYAVCLAEPLDPSAPVPVRRPLPRLRAVAVVAAAAVIAGFAGVASARSGAHHSAAFQPVPTALPTSHAGRPDWRRIMAALDRTRDAAFRTTDAALLRTVYVAGSAPLRADTTALAALAAHHAHPIGLRLDVVSVTVVHESRSSVTLLVVDRLPAYDVVDGHGEVLARYPARGPHTWCIRLSALANEWRIASVD